MASSTTIQDQSASQRYAQWLAEQRQIEKQKRYDSIMSPQSTIRFFLWGGVTIILMFGFAALKKYRESE